MKYSILINTLLFITIVIFSIDNLLAQKKINVIESNKLEKVIMNDTTFQKFSGHVIIKYADLTIICDTILVDEYQDIMTGWGNTQIFNDTLHCTSDSINVIKNKNVIHFHDNTYIKTNNLNIISDQVEYNFGIKKIQYYSGGKVTKNNSTITSTLFTHDLHTNTSNFIELVSVQNHDYEIRSNHITYTSNLINFTGPTIIKNHKFTINGVDGYLKNEHYLSFNNGVIVQFEDKTIESEYLQRNIKNNTSHFQNNIYIKIDKQTCIYGEDMTHVEEIFTITENCKIKLIDKKDTILITGQSIQINDHVKKVKINENVTITGNGLNGKCEIMSFESNYNHINMKKNPVLWFEKVQLTGETIMLYRLQNILDSIYIPTNPFIISPKDSIEYYDQITGRKLEGKFEKNNLKQVIVDGNSEMKYFEYDDDEPNNISMNNVKSSSITLMFENKKIHKVLFAQDVASYYKDILINMPYQEDVLYLQGFKLEKKHSKHSHFTD